MIAKLALTITLAISAAPPTPGEYVITQDQVRERQKVWGLNCDRGFKKTKSTRGGSLKVAVKGKEWSALGSGRRFGTGICEGRNKTLRPEAKNPTSDGFTLRCRSERVTLGTEKSSHKISSTADTIKYSTIAEQYFMRQGDQCVAILERITVAQLVPEEKPEEPVAYVDPCAKPGAPAKITVSPKVFDAKVGETAKCIEVQLEDKNGCQVQSDAVVYSVDPANAGSVSDKGCFSPSKSIKEEEAVAVIASIGTLEGVATARVVPAAMKRAKKSYKALAKTSRSEKAREVLGEVTRGEIVIKPLEKQIEVEKTVEAEEEQAFPWGLVVGGLLALLAAGGGGFVVYRKRQIEGFDDFEEATALTAAPVVTPQKGGGLVCPQCKFEFAKGQTEVCPFDGYAARGARASGAANHVYPAGRWHGVSSL